MSKILPTAHHHPIISHRGGTWVGVGWELIGSWLVDCADYVDVAVCLVSCLVELCYFVGFMEVVFFEERAVQGVDGVERDGVGTDFLSKDAGWRNVFRMEVSG